MAGALSDTAMVCAWWGLTIEGALLGDETERALLAEVTGVPDACDLLAEIDRPAAGAHAGDRWAFIVSRYVTGADGLPDEGGVGADPAPTGAARTVLERLGGAIERRVPGAWPDLS